MEPLIKIENLSVIYDRGLPSEMTAINNINADINPKEFVIIFGPSGCGKSTLLYSISGMETEYIGKILITGKSIHDLNQTELAKFRRDKVGLVFQSFNLIPSLNVLMNTVLPQIFKGGNRLTRARKAKKLLARFNILNLANRLPQFLSGGQQQRVAIARSLINEPSIILADEPLGNLDSKSALEVMKIFEELNQREGKTVIMVTHEALYLKYAEKIIYMKDGEIIRIETQKPAHVGESLENGEEPENVKHIKIKERIDKYLVSS